MKLSNTCEDAYPCGFKTPNMPFQIITPRILIPEKGQSYAPLFISYIIMMFAFRSPCVSGNSPWDQRILNET